MDNEMRTENNKSDPGIPVALEFENGPDATGYWFAAAVLFAVLAAGFIVYRAANLDTVVASNQIVPVPAQTNPITPSPLIVR